MRKLIGFLVFGCFCLSAIAIASNGLSNVGKGLQTFGKKAVGREVAGLSQKELKALVTEIIEISLEEFKEEYSGDSDYMPVSEKEKENGKKEVMNIIMATPDLLEQARDENGEISAKKLNKILKDQGKAETDLIIAKSNIDIFELSLAIYELDNGFYPSTNQGLLALAEKPASNQIGWNGPYLKEIPEDPWENSYHYISPGIHNKDKFDLSSYGPDEIESADDINNWN